MEVITANRRDLLLMSLLSALPLGISEAAATPIDPEQTIIRMPDKLEWKSNPDYPEHSVNACPLVGDTNQPGLYYTLVRWWPGYMSAPHTYETDRYCVVVSETWWCNSGADFDPKSCVPVRPAALFIVSPEHHTTTGSFAGTPTLLSSPFAGLAPSNMRPSIHPSPGGDASKRPPITIGGRTARPRASGDFHIDYEVLNTCKKPSH